MSLLDMSTIFKNWAFLLMEEKSGFQAEPEKLSCLASLQFSAPSFNIMFSFGDLI